ncbi:MAG: hypothetical protein WA285_19730 [Mycobacterium sp.]
MKRLLGVAPPVVAHHDAQLRHTRTYLPRNGFEVLYVDVVASVAAQRVEDKGQGRSVGRHAVGDVDGSVNWFTGPCSWSRRWWPL